MAAPRASAARLEQCILTGGRPSSASATSRLVIFSASSTVFPMASSVIMLEVAMAAPQPKVLNLMSVIMLFSTLIHIFIISPQRALPTSPMPSASGISPTLRGLVKCSMTLSEYMIFLLSLIERRHGPQPLHYARNFLKHEIHICLGVFTPQGQAQRTVGNLMGQTHGQEHMGGV